MYDITEDEFLFLKKYIQKHIHKYVDEPKGIYLDDLWFDCIHAIGMSCRCYKPSNGCKFTSYAIKSINNKLKASVEYKNRQKRDVTFLPIDKPIKPDTKVTYLDAISPVYNEICLVNDILDDMKKVVNSDKQIQVLALMSQGYMQTEIAQIMGCTKININALVRKARQSLLANLDAWYY